MTTMYISRLMKLAEQAGEANSDAFEAAASKLSDSLANKGLIHLYGSGHSVLPVQETFPRYGSYVGFNPLTDPRVMWHNVLGAGGVRELLWLERTEHYAEKFLDHQPLNPGDSIVIFGHSGRNSSGIDTALYAKKRGLTVVAITAKSNLDKPATHSSGKRLADAADIVIDTCAPIEDAIVDVEGWSRPVAGSSTVLAMIMMHELVARVATKLGERGIELPTFASPTIAGVTLHDTDQIYGIYRERMIDAQQKHLGFFKERMAGDK
ncbi:sugar isomerase domain-containing protein [Rhizobium sp. KVB221]|uniref:Sugar isomerase domain-containing protein n=1 Tax=Rhizobium setariae TaxID=2801340 RepID=A0A936YRF0_9HYPH|nr:sugar isomerase domain-containing protein [Rhizobium setariae]MBL0373382.1 sugar isomerase domain-containing protein [Rhizobium setariae]